MKKFLTIAAIVLAALLLVVAAAGLILYKKLIYRAPAEKYTPYPITQGERVNSKMLQLKALASSDIPCEPIVKHTVEPTDIALTPDSPEHAEANAKALNEVIKRAKNSTRIILPSGKFYIGAPLTITDKSDITITSEGDGALLINTAYSPFPHEDASKTSNIFNLISCNNMRIQNIAFDYQSYVSADGVIISHSAGRTYFRLFEEYLDSEKNALLGGELVSSVFMANEQCFTEEVWPETPFVLEKSREGVFYLPTEMGQVGERITCRFKSSGPYISYVIHAYNTSGLILENLRCYSCPGGFVLATDGNSDLYIENVTVAVKEGSKRLLGSNEDCLHLRNIAGVLRVKNSSFYGIGDDALNIHSTLIPISEVNGNTALTQTGGQMLAFGCRGETVEFFDKDYNSVGCATIDSVWTDKITFDAIPSGVESGYYIQNVSALPDTVVSNCNIGFARARGLLIQSKNCVIENCSFKNIRLSAILVAPDFEYWHEGGFCDNLLIENNAFHNCASLNVGFGVVHISTAHDKLEGHDGCRLGHKNVSIIGNTYENCTSQPLKACAVQNLITE